MRLFHRHFVSFIALSFAFLTPILEPVARFGDRIFSIGLTFLDRLAPFTEMAHAGLHPAVLPREVKYLTTGLHRLAQPILMRAGDDPKPDDEGDEETADDIRFA